MPLVVNGPVTVFIPKTIIAVTPIIGVCPPAGPANYYSVVDRLGIEIERCQDFPTAVLRANALATRAVKLGLPT
jgi:hypothetical protein